MQVLKIAVKNKLGYGHYEYICSCGYRSETMVRGEFLCPNCENDDVVFLDRRYKTKQIRSDIKVVEKGLKHFKIERMKYRLVFNHEKHTMEVKSIDKEELYYDLGKKYIWYKNKDKEVSSSERHYIMSSDIDSIFKELDSQKIVNKVSVDENRDLLSVALNEFGDRNRSYYGWRKTLYLSTALIKLIELPYIEILYFSGINTRSSLKNLIVYYRSKLNINESKPHKILGVKKSMMKYVKKMKDVNMYQVQSMNEFFDKVGGNNFKEIFDIILEECGSISDVSNLCDHIYKLYNDYGYKNLKRLTTYICRDVKLQQGIGRPTDATMYMKDYIRMSKELGHDYEKYSKNLKKDHDIVDLNYRIRFDNNANEEFDKRIEEEEYKGLTLKGKEFSIVAPKESNDVIREGESLSHCVASYVKDVAKGICKILFLRDTEDTTISKITIEVRGDRIRQIRGHGNRLPKAKELDFINYWADMKGLIIVGK
jgi:hypothetical protein